MLLKDYLKQYKDKFDQIALSAAEHEDAVSLEGSNKERVKQLSQAYRDFLDILMTLNPNTQDDIIFVVNTRDDFADEECDNLLPYIFNKNELEKHTIEPWEYVPDVNNLSADEAEQFIEALIQKESRLTSYGFEFSPWSDWLGLTVDEESFKRNGIEESIASILYEMTFNGFTEKQQDERRRKLQDSVEEAERLAALPEEERNKHYVSLKDVCESFGITDDRTEEERRADKLRLHKNIIINHNRQIEAMSKYVSK